MGRLASETSVARPNSAVAKAFYLHLAQALTINFSQHLLVHLFFTVCTCIQSFSLGAQGNLLLFEAIMAVWHNRLIWKFDKISPALAFGLAWPEASNFASQNPNLLWHSYCHAKSIGEVMKAVVGPRPHGKSTFHTSSLEKKKKNLINIIHCSRKSFAARSIKSELCCMGNVP